MRRKNYGWGTEERMNDGCKKVGKEKKKQR
jgi:hypothetical protein